MSEVKFLVIKETVSTRFCSRCSGTGRIPEKILGAKIMGTCSLCRGSGKEKITHRTEITLQEAINLLYQKS